MPEHDRVGLRAEDLSARERVELAQALAEDPALREEQAIARELGARLAGLAAPGGGTPAEVVWCRARAGARRAHAWRLGLVGAGGLALAAGLLLVLRPPPVRDRALGGPATRPGEVHLELAAEGPAGPRPLGEGGRIGIDERLLARVQTTGGGLLVLLELRDAGWRRVSPPGWRVEAGRHTLGGAQPMAWRTEDGAGSARYLALLCADEPALDGPLPPPGCAADALVLAWTE